MKNLILKNKAEMLFIRDSILWYTEHRIKSQNANFTKRYFDFVERILNIYYSYYPDTLDNYSKMVHFGQLKKWRQEMSGEQGSGKETNSRKLTPNWVA